MGHIEKLTISSPGNLRQEHPGIGWICPNYPEIPTPEATDEKAEVDTEIAETIKEITKNIEDALRDEAKFRVSTAIKGTRRRISIIIDLELPRELFLRGERLVGRKDLIQLYKNAGWSGVDILNQSYPQKEHDTRRISVHLTYWQDFGSCCRTGGKPLGNLGVATEESGAAK